MNTERYISPELASGFRDYLPEDMIPRQEMFDKIRSTFELFGFVPLDTPGLEKEEILTGGDPNFRMQIFRAGLREGSEDLALRFDLTVPLARVVSLYGDKLEKPFKRYQIGKVWRGEKPQAGRFREFVQFDADIVGTNRMSADAEVVALMFETLSSLGLRRFLIKVNNRKVLNGLSDVIGYDRQKGTEVLRSLDKLDKIGWEGVKLELSEKVSLNDVQTDLVKGFIDIQAPTTEVTLQNLSRFMQRSAEATQGIAELREMAGFVEALGVPADNWRVDLSVARGLGYYTGPVFETGLLDLPSIGSVFSGGRYDNLVSRFSDRDIPATGASVGVDRLFAAMDTMGLIKKTRAVAQAIVLNFDMVAEDYCQRVATVLRKAGVSTELYLGKETNIKGQLAYATRQSTPVVLIAGGNEKSSSTVQVKDMRQRRQEEVPFVEVAQRVKVILT